MRQGLPSALRRRQQINKDAIQMQNNHDFSAPTSTEQVSTITHLLRLDPDMRLAGEWMAAEGLLTGGDTDASYGWHALLCATFGKADAPKPFRLVARGDRPAQLLAYSPLSSAELVARAADFADPKAYAALGIVGLTSKPMPIFSRGGRLGFSCLARPVVRTDRGGNRAKCREIDVCVHARAKGDTRERAVIYLEWARDKLTSAGAGIEKLWIDGVSNAKVLRRGEARGGYRNFKAIRGWTIAFGGTLHVADETRFAEAIARGIGRHRAFGFGMLLVAPPDEG